MPRRLIALLLALPLAGTTFLVAQERIDDEMNWKIRKEATNNSQILRTLHFLSDVYGPRLTGSPNLKNAGEWAISQMTEWGLQNGHLEPWDFGHPGWLNEKLSVHIVSPVKDHLTAEVLAWTPGTDGVTTAPTYHMRDIPGRPSASELAAFLETHRSAVVGKVVLVGNQVEVPVSFFPPALRRNEDAARAAFDPDRRAAGNFGRPAAPRRQMRGDEPILNGRAISQQIDAFLLEAGAAIRINDAGRDHGQIRAFSNRTYDPAAVVPTLVMRNEDYGRIARVLGDGTPVELEVDIVNQMYPEGTTVHNAIAEIPGTDKANEVIMLGGHLDSWHAATGATDNGIGSAVMMEAARILAAVGARPRRTIRVALWGGEEQGLLGSRAYVAEHFGSAESPKPEFYTFGGYFNIDSGTGQARGATVFGPAEAADVLRAALKPFEDINIEGSATTRSRRRGGSDHTSFNNAGLPGISMGQDPVEYRTYTWHTNLDTYERIVVTDAQKSAIAIAAAVYHLANRDELLPRFGDEDMPEKPGSPPTQ